MVCTKCGVTLPGDSRFCGNCGQTMGVVSVGGGAAAAVAPARIPAPEPKSSNAIWSVIGIVLLLVLAAASWYVQSRAASSLPQSQQDQESQQE